MRSSVYCYKIIRYIDVVLNVHFGPITIRENAKMFFSLERLLKENFSLSFQIEINKSRWAYIMDPCLKGGLSTCRLVVKNSPRQTVHTSPGALHR
jgi:uncharacterized protein YqkB